MVSITTDDSYYDAYDYETTMIITLIGYDYDLSTDTALVHSRE
jgi:hypothetical protein